MGDLTESICSKAQPEAKIYRLSDMGGLYLEVLPSGRKTFRMQYRLEGKQLTYTIAMRTQKGLDGTTPINVVPRFLVVGPALETAAEKLLASIYAATLADVNPFSGKLSLLVEPRITDESFYVFADPAVLPVLEYAYLSSAQGPQMASRKGWDVLGMEFRVVLDFGCGAVDWRGAYLNPGA